MNARPPDPAHIEEVATELGVDRSFIEKDWHAVQMLVLLQSARQDDLRLVFSGGTSLSKGYGLIRRFSEDLDFKVRMPGGGIGRAARSHFRKGIISAIREDARWQLEDKDIEPRNQSRFFRLLIGYEQVFAVPDALRPQIRLEVTFESPALDPYDRSLASFMAEIAGAEPEVPTAPCISPAETAADKLSAFAWRVVVRDRNAAGDDPTLIRHLHDLAALEALARESGQFKALAKQNLERDFQERVPETFRKTPVQDHLQTVIQATRDDSLYKQEYDRFVRSMSYASEAETIHFEAASEALRRLIREVVDG